MLGPCVGSFLALLHDSRVDTPCSERSTMSVVGLKLSARFDILREGGLPSAILDAI